MIYSLNISPQNENENETDNLLQNKKENSFNQIDKENCL